MEKKKESWKGTIEIARGAWRVMVKAVLIMPMILNLGCGGRPTADEDSQPETLRIESVAEREVPEESVTDAVLTSSGIGPVKTGIRIVEIKPQVENLYDTIVSERGYESNSYYFYLHGEQRFTVYEFDPGMVSVVSADNGSVVVATPDGDTLRLGDDFGKVLSLKGVKSVWQAGDGEGLWSWNWNGLWFMPDQTGLTEEFEQKLYNQSVAPPAKDFSGVKIGYIGTGVPF